MSSFQNPVGGAPRDPLEKPLRIESIEEDKLTKNEKPKTPGRPPSDEKLGIVSFLLQMFRKAVDFCLESSGISYSSEMGVRENLLLFKASLEILKREDRSQDADFLNQLSRIWRRSLEDALHFKNDNVEFKFKVLVKKIQHYPENQPYTFGYYLTENADQKWVPFPYMELIQKIHAEHEKNPSSSTLTEWTLILEELAALLKDE